MKHTQSIRYHNEGQTYNRKRANTFETSFVTKLKAD